MENCLDKLNMAQTDIFRYHQIHHFLYSIKPHFPMPHPLQETAPKRWVKGGKSPQDMS